MACARGADGGGGPPPGPPGQSVASADADATRKRDRSAANDGASETIKRYVAVLWDVSDRSLFVRSDPAFRHLYQVGVFDDYETTSVDVEIIQEVLRYARSTNR